MSNLAAGLERLQEKIVEAETQLRSLRSENARLRATIESAPPAPDPSSARGGRPMRQIVLESERQEIRTRIRNLIQAL